VLNARPDYQDDKAGAAITVNRSALNRLLAKEGMPRDAVKNGTVKIAENADKVDELMTSLDDPRLSR
jgi:alkyl sulfatase BDS1-like metallo-beta-lactamase superfamily hydrolase